MIRHPLIIWIISGVAILMLLLTGLLPHSVDPVLAGFTPTPAPPGPPPPPPGGGGEEDPGKKPGKIPAPPPPLQLPTVVPSELPLPVLPETGGVGSFPATRSLVLFFLGAGMMALAVWGRRR